MKFPNNFLFGSATAAYQIEGAAAADGRGVSIWDTFSHTPGRTRDGDTGDVAADHYHRVEADLDLMAELGLQAYRFSISWPRIVPNGWGAVNRRGIDFYSRLVDGLLERGIAPFATLYHWDLPQNLEDRGGWPARATADAFAEYAAVVGRALGDRVNTWITLNEPWSTAFHGYGDGGHAPGRISRLEPFLAVHTLNRAHGLAIQALQPLVAPGTQFSVALDLAVLRPEGESGATACERLETVSHDTFLGPMLEGRYSDRLLELTRSITDWSFVKDGDLEVIHQPLDVLGVNYYHTDAVGMSSKDRPRGGPGTAWPGAEDVEFLSATGPLTDMGWNIDPDGLYDILAKLHTRYPELPLLITENGAAFPDLDLDGVIQDDMRIEYVREHLGSTLRALQEGVDVRAYFLWSFMDNFEWSEGYSKRFGIVRVDYDSQERIPKESARWYARVIDARSVAEEDLKVSVAVGDRQGPNGEAKVAR